MNNITEKVLDAIKGDKPEAKWKFRVHDYSLWLAGVASVIIGSLSMSVVIYMLANNDWDMGQQISGSALKFTLLTLPYVWVLVIGLLIILAYYNFRHTKHGYQYRLMTLVMGSILISIILGATFYLAGFGRVIDHTFATKVPIYERFANPRHMIWRQVDSGRLAGEVIAVRSGELDIIDFKKHDWVINIDDDTVLSVVPIPGGVIRIIGTKVHDGRFKADKIFPFDMSKGFIGKSSHRMIDVKH
jgi:hypothetical protein